MAGFIPQANLPFVGAYVAEAEGFFADEGLTSRSNTRPVAAEHLQLLHRK